MFKFLVSSWLNSQRLTIHSAIYFLFFFSLVYTLQNLPASGSAKKLRDHPLSLLLISSTYATKHRNLMIMTKMTMIIL